MATQLETFQIQGMHCEGCAARVTNVLERLPGVRKAEVSYPNATARIEYDDEAVDHGDLKEAVDEAGYSLEEQPA